MASNDKFSSPLATRMSRTVSRLIRGDEVTIAADLGVATFDPVKTTSGDSVAMRRLMAAKSRAQSLSSSRDDSRGARYADYREMDLEVPELGTSLDVMCNFVFGGDSGTGASADDGIRIEFGPGASQEVQDVCRRVSSSLDLNNFLLQVFREGMQLGDSVAELVYTNDQLVAQKAIAPENTDVVWDEYGRLSAYKVIPGGRRRNTFAGASRGSGVTLAPWQVIHFAPDRPRGYKYGRSNWNSARKLWRISQASLDVLAILAILRAAARKSVALPVPAGIKEDEILSFVESLRTGAWRDEFFDKDGTLRHRIASMLELDDIVYPYRSGTEKPTFHNEPAADVSQLVDLQKYLQESYFVATGVPAALCGLERNVNARSTLEQQGLHFVRTVRRRQTEVSRLATDILCRGLLAAGIKPSQDDFRIVMPTVSTFDLKLRAEVNLLRAQATKILAVDAGVDARWVYENVLLAGTDEVDDMLTASSQVDPGSPADTAESFIHGIKNAMRSGRNLREEAEMLREAIRAANDG